MGSAKLLRVWLGSIAIAIILPVVGNQIGRAADCSPRQIDGQCGLSTVVWLLYGVVGSLVILAGAMAYTVILMCRRKATSATNRISTV
jgi:hypothetical protein